MKIGLNFATTLYNYTPAEQVAVAKKAEQCGFASIWSGDHLVLPAVMPLRDTAKPDMPIRKVDPKSPTARVIFPAPEPMPDVFITHAFMAAATTRLEFGTAIYILALRPPMVSARAGGCRCAPPDSRHARLADRDRRAGAHRSRGRAVLVNQERLMELPLGGPM